MSSTETPRVHAPGRTERIRIFAACVAAILLIGAIDYATGLEVSMTALYLAPLAYGAWRLGRRAGGLLAVICAAVWVTADLLQRGLAGHVPVRSWNALMLCGEFAVVALTIAALGRERATLEARVLQRTESLSREITVRRSAEDRLRRAYAALNRTQEKLVEAAKMETVGRMAAGVAHEVKNPLMTLGMGADYFLQRRPENPDEAALLADMKDAVHRASSTINRMLDFARPRPLELADRDVNEIVEGSLEMMRHVLSRQRITVVRELAPDLPHLPLDRARMEHVFLNLITNAVQAMPDGGTLTLRTRSEQAAPGADGTVPHVVIEIDDTGGGIAPEQQRKLFEPFYTTKAPGEGTGLGLAITKKIVEIHQGTITLGNWPGGGARALLRFPVDPGARAWTSVASSSSTTSRA